MDNIEDGTPAIQMAYTLNEEQQNAFDWLAEFCIGSIHGYRKVLLQGYAGTGKTFTLTRMIETVRAYRPEIAFGVTAPTHKAVRVLKKTSEIADGLDFGTIHSFLSLKQKINENTGEVTYEPDFRPNGAPRRVDDLDVLIVDEASMLDDKLFWHLEDELKNNRKLKIIFLGDAAQIPPVGKKEKVIGETNAIPFIPERRYSHNIHLLELVQPQRQAADSPIILYAHAIRNQLFNQHIEFDFKDEYKHALERFSPTGSLARQHDIIREFILTEEFEKDPDYCKFITYSNKAARMCNAMVRELKYGTKDLPFLILEDKLVMEEPMIAKSSVVIPKNEDVSLESLNVDTITFRYVHVEKSKFKGSSKYDPFSLAAKHSKFVDLKVYRVRLITPEGKHYTGNVLHESSIEEFDRVRAELETSAKLHTTGFERKTNWMEFFRMKESFIWVSHNYAITSHKSQGSTYQFTISQEWDMDNHRKITGIEEINRCRYVAASRAKQKLFVVR